MLVTESCGPMRHWKSTELIYNNMTTYVRYKQDTDSLLRRTNG